MFSSGVEGKFLKGVWSLQWKLACRQPLTSSSHSNPTPHYCTHILLKKSWKTGSKNKKSQAELMKWFQQFGHKWPMSLHDSRQKICGFELKRHQRKNYDAPKIWWIFRRCLTLTEQVTIFVLNHSGHSRMMIWWTITDFVTLSYPLYYEGSWSIVYTIRLIIYILVFVYFQTVGLYNWFHI